MKRREVKKFSYKITANKWWCQDQPYRNSFWFQNPHCNIWESPPQKIVCVCVCVCVYVWYIIMMHILYRLYYTHECIYVVIFIYIIYNICDQPFIEEANKNIYWLNDPNHSCPKAKSLLWHLSFFKNQIFLVINILVLWIQIHKASDDPPKIGITAYWYSQQFLPHRHVER